MSEKNEIIKYLKENLKLVKESESAAYGCDGTIKIKLMLGKEEISSVRINGSDIEEIAPDNDYI